MPIRVVAFLAGTTLNVSLSPRSSLRAPPPLPPHSDDPPFPKYPLQCSPNAYMATPSSSATSPSPPMPYLNRPQASQQASVSSEPDSVEEEQRKKAVKKFLARAEIAMLTRSLRTRLSYASYKATHNVPHVPIRDLEAQTQSQAASFNRTVAAKRKAVGAATYYNTPATQGPSTSGAGSQRRGGSGSMAPPASITSPRLNHPSIPGTPSHPSFHEPTFSVRNHPPSLYSSILAPPPPKVARTIHNANDPPLPTTSRPEPSPKSRVQKTSPRTETPRTHPKGKQTTKSHKAPAPASPDRRRTQGGSIDKGKRKQDTATEEVADVDMKAAAALTSLLMHNRPSIAGSASSPRSSIDGSEVGSVYSYSHFAQSSARTSAPNVPTPLSAAPSSSKVPTEPGNRSQTPPPSGHVAQQTTPRAAPTDSEAANLMLFLATSPSPARPANKDAKDMAAYRVLGGGSGPLRSKGRVLFPSSTTGDLGPSGQENTSTPPAGTLYRPPALTRGGETRFSSSISSIGDLGGSVGPRASGTPDGHHRTRSQGSVPSGTSSGSAVGQLLPPAPLPLSSAPSSPAGRSETNANPRPPNVGASSGNNSTLDFNIHEFINASPSSPSRTAHGLGTAGNHKSNLGLRADVGRKLFEEEQMRHAHALQGATSATGGGLSQRQEDRKLGAGIDLVHT